MPVVLKNGVKTAELSPEMLAALVARMSDRSIGMTEEDALFEVLYASNVRSDWICDAIHFQRWPLDGRRPTFTFTEAYGLPRM
jgi:hypothetical protein